MLSTHTSLMPKHTTFIPETDWSDISEYIHALGRLLVCCVCTAVEVNCQNIATQIQYLITWKSLIMHAASQ